jgi:endonuclease YncB( thermonuclease family)
MTAAARIFFPIVAEIMALIVSPPPSLRAQETPCAAENAVPTEFATVDERVDLLTEDGRRIALAGLDIPPERRAAARALLAARLGPGRLAFLAAAGAPDRWGRIVGAALVAGEGGEETLVSVAELLLRQGLARFRPDPAAFACRNGLLAAEAQARRGELGLWASDEYHILDAGRFDMSSSRKGMVVAEGVVGAIGDAGGSLYLNFGPRRGTNFAVVIWKRNLETFERVGLRPRMLTGRRVRVRGLIDTSSGPRMEIFSPAQIELLGAP